MRGRSRLQEEEEVVEARRMVLIACRFAAAARRWPCCDGLCLSSSECALVMMVCFPTRVGSGPDWASGECHASEARQADECIPCECRASQPNRTLAE